jgi:hypothetical protein
MNDILPEGCPLRLATKDFDETTLDHALEIQFIPYDAVTNCFHVLGERILGEAAVLVGGPDQFQPSVERRGRVPSRRRRDGGIPKVPKSSA